LIKVLYGFFSRTIVQVGIASGHVRLTEKLL
jgi:hypothetical protein